MRIAIIGSGIAGLTCAHRLGARHDVTVYEAADRLGGHSNTIVVDDPMAGEIGVDTGFIVHNDRNYPNLETLFAELDVPTVDTEMSFGVSDVASGFEYRATNLNTLLADRRNLLRPELYRMVYDILRFYRAGRRFLDQGDDSTSLAEFLEDGGYSAAFIDLHLIPMGASVWSADPALFDRFPARSLLRFLDNHGLLSIGDRPQWKAIVGGSRVYVDRIAQRFAGRIRLSAPVHQVVRHRDRVEVTVASETETFDVVVVACHSDQALELLADPSPAEKELLGAISYQPNRAVLHTDAATMPAARRAWAAWNYRRLANGDDAGRSVLTYDMTELMRLPTDRHYFVSLNEPSVDPSSILYETVYHHPVFDGPAIAAQRRVGEISGANRTHYAGAYWGYGFHEDGMVSGLRVCDEIERSIDGAALEG